MAKNYDIFNEMSLILIPVIAVMFRFLTTRFQQLIYI